MVHSVPAARHSDIDPIHKYVGVSLFFKVLITCLLVSSLFELYWPKEDKPHLYLSQRFNTKSVIFVNFLLNLNFWLKLSAKATSSILCLTQISHLLINFQLIATHLSKGPISFPVISIVKWHKDGWL